MSDPKEFRVLLDYLYRMELELQGNLDYIREMIRKVGGTTMEILKHEKPRLVIPDEEPEAVEQETVSPRALTRPTADAPEAPGKRRTTCTGCSTKQYGVAKGLCPVCKAIQQMIKE